MALALVLLMSAFIQWTTVRETVVVAPARPDAASYVSYAYNLRQYDVYSRERTWATDELKPPVADAVSPPGYPLFLSLFLQGKPDLQFMARVTLVQAAFGVFTTFFAFLFSSRVLSPPYALAVATLTALSPHLASINTYLLSESLFTVLLVISTWAYIRAMQSRGMRDWAMTGFVFGMCCLVRPTLQVVPLILLLAAWTPSMRPYRRPLAVVLLCWGMVLTPWLIYKTRIPADPGQPSLLRASLYHGSFPDFMYNNDRATYGYAYRYDPDADRIMASNANLESVIADRIAQHPWRYLRWYMLGKPGYFLSWGIVAGMGDIYIYPVATSPFLERPAFETVRSVMFVLHWPLMLLGVAGSMIAVWRPQWLRLAPSRTVGAKGLGMLALCAIALHMIGAPYPRYGIPFRPLFYLMGLMMLRTLWLALLRQKQESIDLT